MKRISVFKAAGVEDCEANGKQVKGRKNFKHKIEKKKKKGSCEDVSAEHHKHTWGKNSGLEKFDKASWLKLVM